MVVVKRYFYFSLGYEEQNLAVILASNSFGCGLVLDLESPIIEQKVKYSDSYRLNVSEVKDHH